MTQRLPDHYFFGGGADAGERVTFSPEETTHALKALRLGRGDHLRWLDGAGGAFVGAIEEARRSGMRLRVLSRKLHPPPPARRLAVGILHDATRLEWLCEKATELGATAITLLRTARVERPRYRLARLEAKTVAALKQSGRFHLPTLRELDFGTGVEEAVTRGGGGRAGLLAHCYDDMPREHLGALPPDASGGELFIGPEGDFTREEVELAVGRGLTAVALGSARLRTETAAVAALSYLSLRST